MTSCERAQLGKLNDSQATEPFIQALKDDSSDVRLGAQKAPVAVNEDLDLSEQAL